MPLPPCAQVCPGTRKTWPQLVGKPGAVAKAIIESDLPGVTAVVIPVDEGKHYSLCCNHVWVVVKNDPQQTVVKVPRIG